MYSKTSNYATFFVEDRVQSNDKITFGRLSQAKKTGKKDQEGKEIYRYENWGARFVGKAREKAAALADKTRINLIEYSCHPGYNADKKQCYPYLVVADFELRGEVAAADAQPDPVENAGDYAMLEDDDAQLPF